MERDLGRSLELGSILSSVLWEQGHLVKSSVSQLFLLDLSSLLDSYNALVAADADLLQWQRIASLATK